MVMSGSNPVLLCFLLILLVMFVCALCKNTLPTLNTENKEVLMNKSILNFVVTIFEVSFVLLAGLVVNTISSGLSSLS